MRELKKIHDLKEDGMEPTKFWVNNRKSDITISVI